MTVPSNSKTKKEGENFLKKWQRYFILPVIVQGSLVPTKGKFPRIVFHVTPLFA